MLKIRNLLLGKVVNKKILAEGASNVFELCAHSCIVAENLSKIGGTDDSGCEDGLICILPSARVVVVVRQHIDRR